VPKGGGGKKGDGPEEVDLNLGEQPSHSAHCWDWGATIEGRKGRVEDGKDGSRNVLDKISFWTPKAPDQQQWGGEKKEKEETILRKLGGKTTDKRRVKGRGDETCPEAPGVYRMSVGFHSGVWPKKEIVQIRAKTGKEGSARAHLRRYFSSARSNHEKGKKNRRGRKKTTKKNMSPRGGGFTSHLSRPNAR